MKILVSFLALSLALQAFSQDKQDFSIDVSTYKSYYLEQSFDGSRAYEFSCVHTDISSWNGKTTRETYHTTGRYVENSSNNGLHVSYSSESSYFNGIEDVIGFSVGISIREFKDEDTLVVTSESRGVNEREDVPTFREVKIVATKKFVDGHEVTVESSLDDDASKRESKVIEISHDPFNTKFTSTSERIRTVEFEGETSRSISRSVCTYSQVGIKSYLDFIPTIITGDWTASSVFGGDPKRLISFRREGTLSLNGGASQEYEIKGDMISFNMSKYKMTFSSPNTVELKDILSGTVLTLSRVRE